nr:hypothetical protein [Tanacetum cinerariifolium]
MTSITSLCELACQVVQKNLEEKQLEEERAAKAKNWKLPVCYDDDDDEESSKSLKYNIISELPPCVAVTPNEPVDSLIMGDEHLNTIPATESDEFIKSCVENLVPNPSESEGENGCDMPAGFTTFSNVLFDDDYDSDSIDDQSLPDEDVLEKIYSNPLFDEEIIPMEIDPHSFNAESDLIESMPNNDSSIIIPSKIDSLFDDESLFAYVVWIFLPFLVYSVVPCYLLSLRNEDIIFDPGICMSTFSKPDISHRCETVKKFNTHRSHLNIFPMLIHGQNNPLLDVPLFHFYPP